MSADQPARDGGEGDGEALAKVLGEVIVRHQRIPLFNGTGNNRCSGCGNLHNATDGPNSPRHAAHVAAEQALDILASDWLAARIAAAEQRGREDNADHAMCYVHGSEALAARERQAGAAALREAAADVEALESFAHGKNTTSKTFLVGHGTAKRVIARRLRDRADRLEAGE